LLHEGRKNGDIAAVSGRIVAFGCRRSSENVVFWT